MVEKYSFIKRTMISLLAVLMFISSVTCGGIAKNQIAEATDAVTVDNEATEIDSLTPTQRNSLNMLNYMRMLIQNVNTEENRNNQLFLETAYNSFDNLFPESVDTKTQAQIGKLMDTIQDYRMISQKRIRLEYIHEQKRAQAMRQAIPNPMGLLSAVQSGSMIKAAVSVIYMAIDATAKYETAASQADQQFMEDGWKLNDEEAKTLHESTKGAQNYLYDMVRAYGLPGDYTLSIQDIAEFVTWSSKPSSQLASKIEWLKYHRNTYETFGPYWLEMAKDYYDSDDYQACLDSIKQYETINTRIFRKNIDYAKVLPMAIYAAKEVLSEEDYIKTADKYCSVIEDNTQDADWSLRYFAAQIYIDLYRITQQDTYLEKAYKLAHNNVNVLVDKQKELNKAFLEDITELKSEKGDPKHVKDEKKQYNNRIKEERKVALPPLNDALYLNCELLFALAEERNISSSEKTTIESILHEDGANIFLTDYIDKKFWFDFKDKTIDENSIEVSFDGGKLTIPLSYISDHSAIIVTIIGKNGTAEIKNWTVKEVKRPKKATYDQFTATFENEIAKNYKYQDGDTVTVKVIPNVLSDTEYFEFIFAAVATKKAVVLNDIVFERKLK